MKKVNLILMALMIVILPLLSGFDKIETIKLKIRSEVLLDDTGGAESDIDKINALYMKPDLEKVLNNNRAMSFYKTGEHWGATSWESYKVEDVDLVENEDETKLIKESVIAWLGVMYEYTYDIVKLEEVDVALTSDEYDTIYEYVQEFQKHVGTYSEDLKQVIKLATELEREYREADDYETVNKIVDFMQGDLHERFMNISRYQFIEDEEIPESIIVSEDLGSYDNPYASEDHKIANFLHTVKPIIVSIVIFLIAWVFLGRKNASDKKKEQSTKDESDEKNLDDEELKTK